MEASGQHWMAFLRHSLPYVLRQSLPLYLKLTDRQPAEPRDLSALSTSLVLELQAHAQLFNVASGNWTQVLMLARWQVLLPLPVSTGDSLRRACAHDATQALRLEGNKISYHCTIGHPLLSVIQVVPVIGLVCSWNSHIFLMNWICLCVHMGPVCLLKFTGGTVYSQDYIVSACASWTVMGGCWGLYAQWGTEVFCLCTLHTKWSQVLPIGVIL